MPAHYPVTDKKNIDPQTGYDEPRKKYRISNRLEFVICLLLLAGVSLELVWEFYKSYRLDDDSDPQESNSISVLSRLLDSGLTSSTLLSFTSKKLIKAMHRRSLAAEVQVVVADDGVIQPRDPVTLTFANGEHVDFWDDGLSIVSDGERGEGIRQSFSESHGASNSTSYVSANAARHITSPKAALLEDGAESYVVAYGANNNGKQGVYFTLCRRDGTRVTTHQPVHMEQTSSHSQLSVTSLSNGDFIVIWVDTTLKLVKFRRYDSTGAALTDVVTVAGPPSPTGYVYAPKVTVSPNGYDISWYTSSSDRDVYTVHYNDSNVETAPPQRRNIKIDGDQSDIDTTTLDNGKVVSAWRDRDPFNPLDAEAGTWITFRIKNTNGTFSPEFHITKELEPGITAENLGLYSVSTLRNNHFCVLYGQGGSDNPVSDGIWIEVFNDAGISVIAPRKVSPDNNFIHSNADISGNNIIWEDSQRGIVEKQVEWITAEVPFELEHTEGVSAPFSGIKFETLESNITVTIKHNDPNGIISTGTYGQVTTDFNYMTRTWTASGPVDDVREALGQTTSTIDKYSNTTSTLDVTIDDGVEEPLDGFIDLTTTPIARPVGSSSSVSVTISEESILDWMNEYKIPLSSGASVLLSGVGALWRRCSKHSDAEDDLQDYLHSVGTRISRQIGSLQSLSEGLQEYSADLTETNWNALAENLRGFSQDPFYGDATQQHFFKHVAFFDFFKQLTHYFQKNNYSESTATLPANWQLGVRQLLKLCNDYKAFFESYTIPITKKIITDGQFYESLGGLESSKIVTVVRGISLLLEALHNSDDFHFPAMYKRYKKEIISEIKKQIKKYHIDDCCCVPITNTLYRMVKPAKPSIFQDHYSDMANAIREKIVNQVQKDMKRGKFKGKSSAKTTVELSSIYVSAPSTTATDERDIDDIEIRPGPSTLAALRG